VSKEADRKEIGRIFKKMVASPFRAILGTGGGVVDVPGKAGWVWARRLGQEEKILQAYNRSIANPVEGLTVLVQESRIEGLAGYELAGTAGGDFVESTSFDEIHIADADNDGDMDPYVAAAWNPMTLSNGANGVIDWVATFGLPEIPKGVYVQVGVRDAASAGAIYYILLQARATTTTQNMAAQAEAALNDGIRNTNGFVAVADNGTTYYSVGASGVNTMDVWLRVPAWI